MATQYVLPPVVASFQARHPAVEVELQPVHQRVAVERLLGYEAAVAVIASVVRSPLVKATPVLRDPLLVVSTSGGESAPLRLEALQGKTLLVLAPGTGLHELVEEALRRRGVSCHLVEHPKAETIKTAVRLGMGVSILPVSAVREELHDGTLAAQEIADWPSGERVIRVLVRSSGRAPKVVSEFVSLLVESYPKGEGG